MDNFSNFPHLLCELFSGGEHMERMKLTVEDDVAVPIRAGH